MSYIKLEITKISNHNNGLDINRVKYYNQKNRNLNFEYSYKTYDSISDAFYDKSNKNIIKYTLHEYTLKDESELNVFNYKDIVLYYYGNQNNLNILESNYILNFDDIKKIFLELRDNYIFIAVDKRLKRFYIATSYLPLFMRMRNNNLEIATYELYDSILLKPYSLFVIDDNIIIRDKLEFPFINDKNILIIHSGGLDSSIMLSYYIDKGYDVKTLFFNYGQKAYTVEEYATRKQAEYYNIERIELDIRDLFKTISNTGSNKIELINTDSVDDTNTSNIKPDINNSHNIFYVPNRNGIMLNIGLAIAEQLGFSNVAMGLNYTERNFPDNTLYFNKYMNKASKVLLKSFYNINIQSPFANMTKTDIVKLGKKLNAPFQYIVSCYYPKLENDTIIECMECPSCKLKYEALEYADKV